MVAAGSAHRAYSRDLGRRSPLYPSPFVWQLAHRHAHRDDDGHGDTHAQADEHTEADERAQADAHAEADEYADADQNAHCYPNGHAHCHSMIRITPDTSSSAPRENRL